MNNKCIRFVWSISLICIASVASGQENKKPCIPCEQLLQLRLPDVTIVKAELVENISFENSLPFLPNILVKVPFCRVYGRISAEINFELLVPEQWNGRFLMSGGGGFVGAIQNDLRDYTNQGFATAGTDTGHQGNGDQANWAFNNMERQLNFGRLAVHRTAVVCKAILRTLNCADPSYAYFVGCSRGGGQAMMEAQYYADDFNGYVAGAPAFSWPATGAKFVRTCQLNYPNPNDVGKPVITNENLKMLQAYILKQCDPLDGLTDRIINDPRDCKIDFTKLPLCPDGKSGASCFTQEQLAAVTSVYDPLIIDQAVVYPGFPVGLEAEPTGWDLWISGTHPFLQNGPSLYYNLGTNIFKYLIYNDPSWDYSKYDFKNFFKETVYASAYLDATQTDYSGLKKAKGKMIMYHGWNDPSLSAYSTIAHYEETMKKDQDVQSSIRLFLMPGVLHCGGGTGPDQTDWVKLIQDWVEKGKAPERIVLSKVENGKTVMTRPVYPYPTVTVYNGKGDINDEKNFGAKKTR